MHCARRSQIDGDSVAISQPEPNAEVGRRLPDRDRYDFAKRERGESASEAKDVWPKKIAGAST
jgi:hypothetical protein